MSFSNSKYIDLVDKKIGSVFTGGVIDNSEPWMIPYKNTPYARNFRVNGRGISIRPGFYQYGVSLGATDYPRGISAYYRSAVANDRIIVRYNTDATHKLVSVKPTDGTQTSIVTAGLITSDNRMNFVSANDSLYCMNGVDLIGKLNGVTYTNPIATLKPSFGGWFNNSMWIAGDPANPTHLYQSVSNTPEDFSGGGSNDFTFPYPIVGLTASMETLYIFSENSIDMINSGTIKQNGADLIYTTVPLESMEGAVSHNTIINVGRSVYFLSRSGKIKKVTPQQLTYDISELSHRSNRGITKTMQTLSSDQSTAFAYAIPDQQIIKWHLKSKGSTFNDICIIYNYEYDEFMVDTQKVFYAGCYYKTQNFTVSQIEPKLYLDEIGQSDDDSPIPFEYNTKHIDLGLPTMHKELWQSRLFVGVNNLANLTQEVYMDGNLVDTRTLTSADIPIDIDGIGTLPIGSYAIGEDGIVEDNLYNLSLVREKGNLQVRGKYFKFRYTNTSLGGKVLLQTLQPNMEVLNQLVSSTLN